MTEIVRATPTDLDELLPLVAAFHEFEEVELSAAARHAAVSGLLDSDVYGDIWLATEGQTIIGYAAICFGYSIEFGGRDAFLDEVYVVPERRKAGLGIGLLKQSLKSCKDVGIRALHLEVSQDNLKARDLYLSLGFELRDKFNLMSFYVEDND